MRKVDLLRPGQRILEEGGVEVAELMHAFNQMLDRLETERERAVGARCAPRRRSGEDRERPARRGRAGADRRVAPARGEATRAQDEAAVRQALEEVRRIARELRPEMLEQLGLVSALTELSRSSPSQSGVPVERRFADDLPPLSDEAELAVYRIAQESLTNVARHADASRVESRSSPEPRASFCASSTMAAE